MPYTFVLTPPADQMMKYIEASQALYSDCDPSYLLAADGTSSPHITVVQFDCESAELAQEVWRNMCEKMKEESFSPFVPPFVGMAFVDGAGPYTDTTWVEVSVKRGEEDSPVMKVHAAAVGVLHAFGLKPLNAIGSNYRPHLTLARIVMPESLKAWPKTLCEGTGEFKLTFGMSDDKWQFMQTLGTFPEI